MYLLLIVSKAFDHCTVRADLGGAVQISYKDFSTLALPVAYKLIKTVIRYINGGNRVKLQQYHIVDAVQLIRRRSLKTVTFGGAAITASDNSSFMILKEQRQSIPHIPIKLNETVLFNDNLQVTLLKLKDRWNHPDSPSPDTGTKFFIRGIEQDDFQLTHFGIRKVKTTPLPGLMCLKNLPVIIDEKGNHVAIPTFKFVNRSYGVICQFNFVPRKKLHECINYNTV